jgi:DNA-binding XRE family transcriptional regulator
MAKRIIEFIGDYPFFDSSEPIRWQLHCARQVRGETQSQAALAIGCDATTVANIESGRVPFRKTCNKVQAYIDEVFVMDSEW